MSIADVLDALGSVLTQVAPWLSIVIVGGVVLRYGPRLISRFVRIGGR